MKPSVHTQLVHLSIDPDLSEKFRRACREELGDVPPAMSDEMKRIVEWLREQAGEDERCSQIESWRLADRLERLTSANALQQASYAIARGDHLKDKTDG